MNTSTPYYSAQVESPCGPLLCVVDESGAVVRIEFAKGRSVAQVQEDLVAAGFDLREDERRTATLRRQLMEYFAGDRQDFELELAPQGTRFQRQVWSQLQRIPFGATTSYGALSAAIGRPKASRAVGAANGANPIPIVIPCHRVIGIDGSLTGFGGGLDAKKALLELEGAPFGGGEQKALELE